MKKKEMFAVTFTANRLPVTGGYKLGRRYLIPSFPDVSKWLRNLNHQGAEVPIFPGEHETGSGD
ncbi:hypothetical protein AVDCRST_MAG94-5816 [uncultured Leptolyngbya sp.]|uniref:Uncharacterized protein n=1 Tax=uncultured Leptolyngbya sp. TaxID=332963 RepID=A0A6J4NYM6_9CYAN|nr:hypothetical protein AVDCRST_MAG94-5816 [uncultured Leptolyngbya sp.]